MKKLHFVLLFAILMSSFAAYAQSEETYTFPSGVSFIVPAGAVLEAGDVPSLVFGDVMIVELVDPTFIGATPEDTIGAPLNDVLLYLLDLVGYTGTFIQANSFSETLADGREVLGYQFMNSDDLVQTVVVVRLSDDSVGALNIRSLNAPTAADQNMLRTLAASFDVPTVEAVPTIPVKATLVPAATLVPVTTSTLPQSYTSESGVTFGYPSDYILTNVDNPPVSLEQGDTIFITMVEPSLIGIPSGASMQSIISFAVDGFDNIDAAAFAPFDVGGREAVINDGPTEGVTQTMIIVRFADGTAGVMDVFTVAPLSGELLDDVRAIAASFDSQSDVASGPTDAALREAAALFDEAMEFYDARDYASALPLLEQALVANPDWGLGVYWQAATYQHLGDLESALAGFERALALEPAERQILVDISDMHALLDQMPEAVAAISDYAANPGSASLDPNLDALIEIYGLVADGGYHSDFYFGRATQLRSYGRYEEALRDVRVALQNEPMDTTLYALQGGILIDLDRDQEAVNVLTKGLTIQPSSILFLNRAYAYQNLVLGNFSAMIDSAHDFQCVLLTADNSVTSGQLSEAQSALNRMMIQSDDYEEITNVADCVA